MKREIHLTLNVKNTFTMKIRGLDLRQLSPVVDLIIQSRHKKGAKHYLILTITKNLTTTGTVLFHSENVENAVGQG
jgi:hypothetical protein